MRNLRPIVIFQDAIHLLDVLLSQAVALNLNYECIGRSYYFPTPGSVLDIGFGKEVNFDLPVAKNQHDAIFRFGQEYSPLLDRTVGKTEKFFSP